MNGQTRNNVLLQFILYVQVDEMQVHPDLYFYVGVCGFMHV